MKRGSMESRKWLDTCRESFLIAECAEIELPQVYDDNVHLSDKRLIVASSTSTVCFTRYNDIGFFNLSHQCWDALYEEC